MIICAGSIFTDYISRIEKFPKKPIKVLSRGIDKRLGGSAAVSAFTAKILGSESNFIGKFGDDDSSLFLKNELNKAIDDKDNSYVIISKINSGNVEIDPIPLNPITIRDRFRKFIGIVKYL